MLRDLEPWLRRWTDVGVPLADLVTAAELVTAFVVGFVIEEQERTQSAASDPSRYALEDRDTAVGQDAPLVAATGHVRDDPGRRFERQLAIIMAGLAAAVGQRRRGSGRRPAPRRPRK